MELTTDVGCPNLFPSLKKITVFHLTPHALRRIDQRGLRVEDMEAVILQPDRFFQKQPGQNGGFVYEFEKRTPDGRVFIVVGEVKQAECWIIRLL